MKKITLIFLLITSYTFAQTFTDVTGTLPQLKNGFSAWGDYDGDGDADLFYTGVLNASSMGGGLYENDNGTFTLVTNSGLPLYSLGEADWADYDGDGDLDIVITGYNDSEATAHADVYTNNGNGTFTASGAAITGMYMGNVQFVDINNDSHPDVAITGMETTGWTNLTQIYRNNGNGTFSLLSGTSFPSVNSGRMKFADYNADGNLDFVLNGQNSTTNTPYTKLWKNNGDETFTEQNLGFAQLWLGDMEWADYDADGDPDIIISGISASDSEIRLYDNNGDGTFTESTHISNFDKVHDSQIEWADFNQDGHIDVFIMGKHHDTASDYFSTKLYLGNGSVFSEYTGFTFPAFVSGDMDVSDYDNNGYPDLFITGNASNNSGNAKLYQNGTAGTVYEQLANQFEIYPNPAHNFLNIKSKNNDSFSVKIYDFTGKLTMHKSANRNVYLNLSNLPKGVYLIKVIKKTDAFMQKLIIK